MLTLLSITCLSTFVTGNSVASAPACYTYSGQGYCQYTGRVYKLYVNSSGQILLYFDTVMSPVSPTSVGITGVSDFGAGIYNISDNPDYAKMLYASLLAAQARGAIVECLEGESTRFQRLATQSCRITWTTSSRELISQRRLATERQPMQFATRP